MIAALALATALIANPVVEVIDPAATYVSVQAIIKLPELSPHDQAAAALLAEAIAYDVDGYSRFTMRDIAARAGDAVSVRLMPDHIRIQVGVLPQDLKVGVAMIDQILRGSKLPEEALNKAIAERPTRQRSLWTTALWPFHYTFSRMKQRDVMELYHRICRPDNVWIAIGGPIKPGEGDQLWTARTSDWKPVKVPKAAIDTSLLPQEISIKGPEAIVELRGPEFAGNDPALASQLLALIGLGSGKGSAMFTALREAKGWSYRQEAILWPTANGFVPRLILPSSDPLGPAELAKGAREQLLGALSAWTDSDLARAKGMAEGILLRDFELSPLYFRPTRPIDASLHDRTFMAAYWPMKTGQAWLPTGLLEQMKSINLEEFKSQAKGMLEVAIPRLIEAGGG